MGGLATTSSVGSSFSSPLISVQRNTRICARRAVLPSLRSLLVAEATGAGISSVTGATWREAAPAGVGRDIGSAVNHAALENRAGRNLRMTPVPRVARRWRVTSVGDRDRDRVGVGAGRRRGLRRNAAIDLDGLRRTVAGAGHR